MSVRGKEITIVGAGVAGLCLARALALKGARVELLEQARAIREFGAGLQISPNGAVVLQALGLGDELRARSSASQAVTLYRGEDRAALMRLDLSRKSGWHLVHRADLIDILAAGAREAGVQITLETRIEAAHPEDGAMHLQLADGRVLSSAFVVGADGIHSKLRVALNGAASPVFSGQVAWRTVIPAQSDDPAEAEVHMGQGRHLVSYPLRGGLLRNIVAVEERATWVSENWQQEGDPTELRAAFAAFSPRVQGWLEQVQQCWLWGLFNHPVAKHWCGPHAAIIGDAAHPTLPFLGQGANMALEDGWSLAEALDQGGDLTLWALRRASRCARIVAAAQSNARLYHLRDPWRKVMHPAMRLGALLAPSRVAGRYDWVHDFDVTSEG